MSNVGGWDRIEIDGNDGVGKSTLVALLEAYGVEASDRGDMTKASDDDDMMPREGVLYVLLDVPVAVSRQRLAEAGKDLEEQYHTVDDLTFYRARFLEVAERFQATLVEPLHQRSTLQAVLAAVRREPLRLGMPKGRLEPGVSAMLEEAGFVLRFPSRCYVTVEQGVEAFLLKPRCFPQMVALGMLDVAFCGRDILLDAHFENLVEVFDTGANAVRLLAAARDPHILENPPSGRPLVVATVFPRLVDRWLTELGLAHVILHAHGGTEAFVPRFADLLVDVVETGRTLEANALIPVHHFADSSTVLITRREIVDRVDVRAFVDTLQEISRDR